MKNRSGNTQGHKGTFIVKIEHCSNESWQGEVIWADEEKREKFRSTLELIKLMDEAVNPMENQEETVWKQGKTGAG